MSWKSIACIAALGAMAAPAMAVPSISVVDNLNGTGSINIITTAVGSIGAEITLQLTGATLGGATINSAVYDTPNPGDNPFIAGSPVTGDANGLDLDLAENRLFASFGSGSVAAGTYKLLDFTYTGTGTATGDGFVGSVGALTNVAGVTIDIGDVPVLPGDANLDGAVTAADITSVLSNFGSVSPPPGDANHDGAVTAADITSVLSNFGATASASAAVAVPEPAAAAMALLALTAGVARRR